MKASGEPKTWHKKHRETMTSSQVLADKLALGMGSWTFIIIQTILIIIWIIRKYHRLHLSLGPVSFHFAEPAFLGPGGLCGAGHYDGPKPAGGT